ncbi:hypothetical protein GCM10010213_09050 [Microbacterium maritypicum]|uniref:Uncharacterized protein n=2 Tax=Microbacteriaceae TaxID=85023 RepID=A0A4Y4B6C5_MICMQ|nr:hypothetical protein MLI01_06690 [Microbacterium liquefaciens]GGV52590.1 hypothetical protein GCM10010213_09050 [Microbacterium liquefaciens]
MQMIEESYKNSFRKRLRILFSPLRLALFLTAIIIAIIGNAIYISNGGSPEWLGLGSIIPLLAFLFWELATDIRMRRLERERHGS